MQGNEWADADVADRQPQHCPYCGSDGGFDGLGSPATGYYRHKCGECGHEFLTVLPSAEVARNE